MSHVNGGLTKPLLKLGQEWLIKTKIARMQ